jgi:hypothetical protein
MSLRWSELELERAAKIVAAIESCGCPRRLAGRTPEIHIAVSEIADLFDGIWGGFPVTFIRHLYRELGFDEHRVFKWRLEHKLIQAIALNHYAPGAVPVTCGLSGWKNRASLTILFPETLFLKPALGDSSGDNYIAGHNGRVPGAFEEQSAKRAPVDLLDESFIVQQRIPIATEYRVHTLEDRVIDDLTFHRYGKGDIPGERAAPNAYVQSILDRLPNALVAGNLCGWDVARTPDANFVVIEVNFSGFHPVHNRGFQSSGWFHDEEWGALSTARLVRFLEDQCGVRVSIEPDRPELTVAHWFYARVEQARELLRTSSLPELAR